jgi:hypothetical protein
MPYRTFDSSHVASLVAWFEPAAVVVLEAGLNGLNESENGSFGDVLFLMLLFAGL